MGKEKKRKKDGRGAVENLLYWLKVLYREAPGFVWLYLAEIAVTLGISLLGVYMPSVLVADITAGGGAQRVIRDVALLGGGLACLHLMSKWLEQTKQIGAGKIRLGQTVRLAQATLDADYAAIESPEYTEEFWQLAERHFYSGEYGPQFMQAHASLASAVIGMVLYVGMLSQLSLWLPLLVIAGTALKYMVGIRCNKWDMKNRHKWWELDNKMQYLASELSSTAAAKDVHLYWMPPWLEKKYDIELKQRIRHTVRQQLNYYVEGTVDLFIRMIWEGAAYLYLIWTVCQGGLDAAGAVLYLGVITGFAQWCDSIVSGMRELHKESTYVEEERRFLDRMKTQEGQKEELVIREGHIPEITFEHVTFQYRGADSPVIHDLNLTLHPGENIALVGLNGAGKTTFIKLLCGFYDPTEGRILMDGADRCKYSRKSWIRYFSGVLQDVELFPMSVEENLAPGGERNREKMWECLEMADLADRMRRFPGGLETMFGKEDYEGAADLSGGEKQKLMLARALYKTAPMLVLDEPTAALDPLMESELYQRYCDFSEHRTSVFISHRLASTRFCDRVLLMEDGRITEEGTHEQLLEKDGRYAWMFRLQSKYYQQQEAGLEGEEVQV